MLNLYGGSRSRASIVQWYLEELQVPYEFKRLDMQAGEHLKPEFLAINPMGKVPAIVEDGLQLWESGAILLYLAEKHQQLPTDLNTRSQIYQWVMFANSTLAQGIFIEANREREMPRLLGALNQLWQQQPYLMGEDFSVADVAVGSLLNYIPMMLQLDLSAYPQVLDYMQRIAERPAYQKAIGQQR